MTMMNSENRNFRSYSELIKIDSFADRLKYLLLHGTVAEDKFGYRRYLNQVLYKSPEWKKVRNEIIIRDNGCDLAFPGFEIPNRILIHHINPITVEDIMYRRPIVFDPENLITTVLATHEIIHYGTESDIDNYFLNERSANDTSPWRN